MNKIVRIPFVSLGKNGLIEVTCESNKGPYDCGLYLIKDLNHDISQCVGYPVMSAKIVEYKGAGYGTAFSWIQLINDKFFDEYGDLVYEDDEVDTISQKCREIGFPFFAQGFLPGVYDAPCFNLQGYKKLDWTAHMYLVSTPSRMNDHKIQYLTGFEWGYMEKDNNGTVEVEIKDLKLLSEEDWENAVEILKRDFIGWDYE